MASPPKDDLIRSSFVKDGDARAVNFDPGEGGDGSTLFGHASVFGSTYEVRSAYDGFVPRGGPTRRFQEEHPGAGSGRAERDQGQLRSWF
jgi:hypothetical protein